MKTRTTVILLVIAIGLGVWIKYFESKKPNTAEATRQAGNVLNFDREKLQGIVIQNGNDRIELQRSNGKWRLTAPVQDQADSSAVDNLISDLETWPKEGTIPAQEVEANPGRLKEYGLAQSKLRLRLIEPNGPPEISFGNDAAFENQIYVRLDDSKEVLLATKTVRSDISKKPDDFRDRKLTELSPVQVTRAVIKSPAGEIELSKKDGRWDVTKPLQARGDDEKIADLIGDVTNAHIESFVSDDRGDLHNFGLADPRGSITLFAPEAKEGDTLQIGGPVAQKKDQIYVRFDPRHGVYAMTNKVDEVLSVKPNDLRDRHLLRLDMNNLDRITIEANTGAKTVLGRQKEEWKIANQNNLPANDDEVRRLLERLSDARVTRFVSDTASDLAKYGLDHPQLKVTFSSFASENTAETKAGERPFLTLSFGKTEGNEVYARIGEEPFIVAVSQQLLAEIWADPLRWQELAIYKFKPEDIHRLSRVTDDEESLVRTGSKDWKWVQGTGPIDTTNLQSLLNTLSHLRAVRWEGAVSPAQGLEKPQLILTFTTSPDDKASHKLTIGNQTSDGMWFAEVESHNGVFVISKPDFTALKLPLEKNAPSPSPSPSAAASPALTPTGQ